MREVPGKALRLGAGWEVPPLALDWRQVQRYLPPWVASQAPSLLSRRKVRWVFGPAARERQELLGAITRFGRAYKDGLCVLKHHPFCHSFGPSILLALVVVALESAVLIQGPEDSGADPLATTSGPGATPYYRDRVAIDGLYDSQCGHKGVRGHLRAHEINYLEFRIDHIANTSDLPADAHAEPCDDCPKGEVQGCRPHDASPSFYFRAS